MATLNETVLLLVQDLQRDSANADVWVNGDETLGYVATGGEIVPSIQKMVVDFENRTEFSGEYVGGGAEYIRGETFNNEYEALVVTSDFTSTNFDDDAPNYKVSFRLTDMIEDALDAALAANASAVAAGDSAVEAAGSAVEAAQSVIDAAAEVALVQLEKTYAGEWAKKPEDTLVSVSAGGDGVTDYSALHHSAKADAARVLAEATLYDYGRIAWVDPVNGSDVTGSAGNFEKPFVTMEGARDALLALYTPSELNPVTIKTLGAQTIALSTSLVTSDGFILDLRDGTVLQRATGQIVVLGAGEYCKVLGGEIIGAASYAVVNTDGKFEAVDCVVEGNAIVSNRVISILSAGTASQLILNRCAITNDIQTSNSFKMTDCDVVGSVWLKNDINFEIYDSKINGENGLAYSGKNACLHFSDSGVARVINGLIRNTYLTASAADSFPILYNLSNAGNTFNVALQGCDAFTGNTKIIEEQGAETMTFSGNVLYGNLASVGDGVLSGLTYNGDVNRGW
jgi:hypothetical protein